MEKERLTQTQLELLKLCGEDAQHHPLELDGKVLRFKSDPIVKRVSQMIDLNKLWRYMGDSREEALSMRRFYRNMGYSLCGYLDIFGEMLTREEEEDGKRERGN